MRASHLPGAVPVAATRMGSTAVSMPMTRRAAAAWRSGGRAVVVHDGVMCTDGTPAHHGRGRQVRHEVEPSAVFGLEPGGSGNRTALMGNVTHACSPDAGPPNR